MRQKRHWQASQELPERFVSLTVTIDGLDARQKFQRDRAGGSATLQFGQGIRACRVNRDGRQKLRVTSRKVQHVIIGHEKPRKTRKTVTCFVVEIIAGQNHRPLKGRFPDPGKKFFEVLLIQRGIAGRGLEPDVGSQQIDKWALPPTRRDLAT